MLKWLGGGGGAGGSNGGGNGGDASFTHVGKVFTVNDYQVVVEELIAEGLSVCVCVMGSGSNDTVCDCKWPGWSLVYCCHGSRPR